MRGFAVVVWGALAVLVVACVVRLGENAPPPTPEQLELQRTASARGACRAFIRQALHDPGSAEFAVNTDWVATETAPGSWLVVVPLRAANAFGATVRTRFACRIRLDGETWRLVSLDEV